jgi:hypothetical protein
VLCGTIIQTKYDILRIIYINKYMKCKCNNIIPSGRVKLGFSVCVQCSSVEAYGCAPLINHKTGNSIQIMSSSDAARIAKLTRRRGYGTMLA